MRPYYVVAVLMLSQPSKKRAFVGFRAISIQHKYTCAGSTSCLAFGTPATEARDNARNPSSVPFFLADLAAATLNSCMMEEILHAGLSQVIGTVRTIVNFQFAGIAFGWCRASDSFCALPAVRDNQRNVVLLFVWIEMPNFINNRRQ